MVSRLSYKIRSFGKKDSSKKLVFLKFQICILDISIAFKRVTQNELIIVGFNDLTNNAVIIGHCVLSATSKVTHKYTHTHIPRTNFTFYVNNEKSYSKKCLLTIYLINSKTCEWLIECFEICWQIFPVFVFTPLLEFLLVIIVR